MQNCPSRKAYQRAALCITAKIVPPMAEMGQTRSFGDVCSSVRFARKRTADVSIESMSAERSVSLNVRTVLRLILFDRRGRGRRPERLGTTPARRVDPFADARCGACNAPPLPNSVSPKREQDVLPDRRERVAAFVAGAAAAFQLSFHHWRRIGQRRVPPRNNAPAAFSGPARGILWAGRRSASWTNGAMFGYIRNASAPLPRRESGVATMVTRVWLAQLRYRMRSRC